MEEDVSNAALDSRVRDQYSSLSAICGKYLAIKAGKSYCVYPDMCCTIH